MRGSVNRTRLKQSIKYCTVQVFISCSYVLTQERAFEFRLVLVGGDYEMIDTGGRSACQSTMTLMKQTMLLRTSSIRGDAIPRL